MAFVWQLFPDYFRLADPSSSGSYFVTTVPRSQFRHYERITEADALALYPDLLP